MFNTTISPHYCHLEIETQIMFAIGRTKAFKKILIQNQTRTVTTVHSEQTDVLKWTGRHV